MTQTRPAAGTDEIKAALRRDFPGWSIITTNRDRWWATRNPERDPVTGRLVDHFVTAVEADTSDELHAKLAEVTDGTP
ncbi:hypothetical protein [Actinomadura rudentiformis]|uniref:Uncharacterized protein n=1 Tax=Actinomadura rudentiformis TaxID=359158 RepID=A0A6H9YPG0_9ACTN|nr:hypothetical protein [Actinomadura rudentiformis]KAB2341874.1 hypothetical protein F8566_40565 [Actinomadura rudentiformis]